MLDATELELLESLRERHPGLDYRREGDLHVARWDGQEARGLTLSDMAERVWAAGRPPPARLYPDTLRSPPPLCFMGLPDCEVA